MKLRGYKIIGTTTYFLYYKEDLEKWRKRGREHGDSGMLVFARREEPFNKKVVVYKGFGTIENPCKQMMNMSMIHFPLFDGEWKEPYQIMIDQKKKQEEPITHNYKFYLLDMEEYN